MSPLHALVASQRDVQKPHKAMFAKWMTWQTWASRFAFEEWENEELQTFGS